MQHHWRDVEIFLPSHLSMSQVKAELRIRVLTIADEGGDFVHGVKIDGCDRHGDGWLRWRTSYLSGPPGLEPAAAAEAG